MPMKKSKATKTRKQYSNKRKGSHSLNTTRKLERTIEYDIAIPSYKRPETLNNKTLTLLKYANIPSSKITVFVADKSEYDI